MTSEQLSILTEVIGLVASIGVLLSYIFSNQKKLRIVNLVACVIFIVYGILLLCISSGINGWSVLILNFFSGVVHIIWLIKHRKE